MVEAELDIIKNKLKDDTFDLQDCERKLIKIEKKLLQLENKFNNIKINEINNSNDDDSNNSTEDDNINIDNILKDLSKMETDITDINTNISIEKLIDNYIEFKMKLESIKNKNNDYKLKIDYL